MCGLLKRIGLFHQQCTIEVNVVACKLTRSSLAWVPMRQMCWITSMKLIDGSGIDCCAVCQHTADAIWIIAAG